MNSVIVVTGATSGVGKEIVKSFLETTKWQVIGIARSKEKLKKLKKNYGKRFKGILCDLQNSDDVEKAFEKIKKETNHIDIIVNNAAVFKMKPFSECDANDIDQLIDVNLKGVLYTTLEALKIMKSSNNKRGSRIINIASVASLHGIEKQSIYCASKFGVNGFAEALNQEIIKDNISISTIFPGGINTPLWNSSNQHPSGNTEELLSTTDIVDMVKYISNLDANVILKNVTLFPSNEWH